MVVDGFDGVASTAVVALTAAPPSAAMLLIAAALFRVQHIVLLVCLSFVAASRPAFAPASTGSIVASAHWAV